MSGIHMVMFFMLLIITHSLYNPFYAQTDNNCCNYRYKFSYYIYPCDDVEGPGSEDSDGAACSPLSLRDCLTPVAEELLVAEKEIARNIYQYQM